jgi:hypothetical protein
MSRPALALINTETGEVVNRRLPDDPQAEKLEELTEENEGLRTSLRSLNAQLRKARHELNELLDNFAPDEEWTEFVAWWIAYTGRTQGTKVDPGTDRCKHYKKLRKRFERREVALMVVGAHHHHFAPFRDRDDMEDFAKSLKWAETCLRIGLERNPPKEEAE